ncbi:DEKNAAC102569 [Brettanomyces naardenensis]|uniref:Multiple RNA-binding domain-containing protein 1 n=1 Tax=Brettanomyces naardenensis TaxID=13370 RepID=A0A448YK97_BRENA|nr:DEKNAAC102569 [Brettanomyces naardenensis]
MSRVIVKGLPPYYTEDKLKGIFSEEGSVTDIKLIRKRNGESRRFAFVGFKSMDDAENAVKRHNDTYIDTSKVTVQLAKTMADPTLPLSWREKRRVQQKEVEEMEEKLHRMQEMDKSVRMRKKQKTADKHSLEEKITENPELQEFMETMKSSGQSRSWDNSEVVRTEKVPLELGEGTVEQKLSGDDSDADYDDLDKQDLRTDDTNEEIVKLNIDKEKTQDEDTSNMDDFEWFKNKRVRIPEKEHQQPESGAEIEKEQSEEHSDDKRDHAEIKKKKHPTAIVREPQPTEEEKNAQQISETGRLFLRNILYTSAESDFRGLFSSYGELEEVHVAVDTRTGTSKGFAYVQFKNPEDAVRAYQELDRSIFQGRLLHILPGKPKKENKVDEFALANMPLKKQKFLKRKYGAAKQQFSWNSLYMNNDAVLESVASDLGISKSDLIDPENSNSAVKQALAEAHVIGDVRKYFEGKGVDLMSFQQNERDDKVILVKNFLHGTTREEIGERFAQYGKLDRILMPPAGTIAIVEFRDAPSGRTAFNKQSFKRLGKSILYLEKGPKGLFNKKPEADDALEEEAGSDPSVTEVKKSTEELMAGAEDGSSNVQEEEDQEEEQESGPTVSVFIKNLNFSTNSGDITDLFKSLDGFVVAVVKTKPDSRHPGKMMSMGFGFVEFRTKTQAQAAIRAMDGYILDGHKLQLKLSTRGGSSSSAPSHRKKSLKSTKIIVKNLPFEATRKDVLELFNSFGNLKSVRVPKKFDKSARGFAFVEFSTVKEAEGVMDQLQGVHLLGRRLVLDFAEKEADNAEEEIERMTKKARKQADARRMASIRESNTGKSKLDIDELEEE